MSGVSLSLSYFKMSTLHTKTLLAGDRQHQGAYKRTRRFYCEISSLFLPVIKATNLAYVHRNKRTERMARGCDNCQRILG